MQALFECKGMIFATLNPIQENLHLCDLLEAWNAIPTQTWIDVVADCSCNTLGAVNLASFFVSLHV